MAYREKRILVRRLNIRGIMGSTVFTDCRAWQCIPGWSGKGLFSAKAAQETAGGEGRCYGAVAWITQM